MSFDEDELRRALEARSGEPSADYRARVRQSLAADAGRAVNWTAAVAVVLVTVLTATSVGVLVASRHGRTGPVASGPRVTTPSPVEGANVQLSAPSANVVWALVDYRVLYVSTDRGDHWDQRTMPPNPGVRPAISFLDQSEGWLLAPGSPATQCQEASAAIWHTTDGGKIWHQLQVSGLDAAQCKEQIYFADRGHGFITAWDQNHQPSVYWSPDGVAWKRFTLLDPPDYKSSPGGFTLRVEWIKKVGDTYYLEAYGEQGAGSPYPDIPHRQYVYTSTTFGQWVWRQKVPSRILAIVTPARWLEIDGPGQLAESVNGGQAIGPYASDVASDTPVDGAAMVFGDAQTGYIAAAGTLQRTVNGGSHWTRLSPPWSAGPPSPGPTPTPIMQPTSVDLSAPSGTVVWAFVGGSELFVSSDSGDTWSQRTLPAAAANDRPVEISFLDTTTGWISTCGGTTTSLWRTSDGARKWVESGTLPNPPGQCVRGLSFFTPMVGLAAANSEDGGPKIYRTSDGGISWSASSLPDPPGFRSAPGFTLSAHNAVRFGGTELMTAYGQQPDGGHAYAFRSTDDGATWSYVATIPNTAVSVAFVTESRWLQVIAPGQSVETTDGGKSWHAYASDYSQAAPVTPEVVFGDASVGYATVRGSIQRTTDGGAHWTPIKTPGT